MADVRWCSLCRQRAHLGTQDACDDCMWLGALGELVSTATLVDASRWRSPDRSEVFGLSDAVQQAVDALQREALCRVLDAAAYLLRAHAIERARHRRELNEAVRDQRVAARDGYYQGREDEAERGVDW